MIGAQDSALAEPNTNGSDTHLVQVSLVHVDLQRRPRGERPVFELELRPDQQIVGVDHYWTTDLNRRETVDHHANLWVSTRL